MACILLTCGLVSLSFFCFFYTCHTLYLLQKTLNTFWTGFQTFFYLQMSVVKMTFFFSGTAYAVWWFMSLSHPLCKWFFKMLDVRSKDCTQFAFSIILLVWCFYCVMYCEFLEYLRWKPEADSSQCYNWLHLCLIFTSFKMYSDIPAAWKIKRMSFIFSRLGR